MRRLALMIAFIGCLGIGAVAPPSTRPTVNWIAWNDAAFARAKAEHKFVILDLHAVWCHWCHVMDDTTYRDPAVIKLLSEHYVTVGVDADNRPDLANRYEDYGWPATIVFDSAGKEIVKRRGYLTPKEMASMLQAIIDDPTPGPSVRAEVAVQPAASAALPPVMRSKLMDQLRRTYDIQNHGWGTTHKFIDVDVIDFCLASDINEFKTMAGRTLAANQKLIDPVWGGVYQYSTDGDWVHPHFEKIMSFQADNLRAYSHAWASVRHYMDTRPFENPQRSAEAIRNYLRNFLTSPDGAFYTSQDADLIPGEHAREYFSLDDAARRKLGIPQIDKHIYARENGWAITGLVAYYSATGEADALTDAIRAAEWIVAHRSLRGGGLSHDERDIAGPYLGDTLAMGRAFLALYSVTGDRVWLMRASESADFIAAKFPDAQGVGFITAANDALAKPQVDENTQLARFANLLFQFTGKKEHRATAEAAMKYIASPQVLATRNWLVGGILLVDRELATDPIHIAIVGPKVDPLARQLFEASLPIGTDYVRREWIDPADGPLPRQDVEYPKLKTSAAFLCANGACSRPMSDVDQLRAAISKATK
ncbi:hypothetical protein BH10PLA1_BH10PLA1_05010 [soil metagenome]